MRRTSAGPVVLLTALGIVLGFGLDTALAARGQVAFVPPISLAVALVLIGALLIALALPVRRAAKGEKRIDPFYATRVVILAQSSALGAALLLGLATGILVYLLSRTVIPVGSTLTTAAGVVAAVLLLISALVAEYLCSLPPESDDDADDAAPAPG